MLQELNLLTEEIKETLIKQVDITGRDFGCHLGFIEKMIALYYIFNSPDGNIQFDLSPQ